jgi:hypothetical protein
MARRHGRRGEHQARRGKGTRHAKAKQPKDKRVGAKHVHIRTVNAPPAL